jgi:hypothetical protein
LPAKVYSILRAGTEMLSIMGRYRERCRGKDHRRRGAAAPPWDAVPAPPPFILESSVLWHPSEQGHDHHQWRYASSQCRRYFDGRAAVTLNTKIPWPYVT